MESPSTDTTIVRRGPECWAHIPIETGVGALLILGGGETPAMIHDLFFHLAGGTSARVKHIPSATRTFEDIPDLRTHYEEFFAHNPASFDFLHTYDRAIAERKEFASPLEDVSGVWIGGGDQGRLADLFVGTEVVSALNRVVDRGGVVAGTSSGAAIMSNAMICYGYEEPEFGQGFGLYPGTIVDPHFSGRKREKRLCRALLLRPDHIGVGVDEWTALVIHGRTVASIGSKQGSIWFHFADPDAGQVRRYRLRIGETVQLSTPVRGADPRVLENALRGLREPDVITAEELIPEPEPA